MIRLLYFALFIGFAATLVRAADRPSPEIIAVVAKLQAAGVSVAVDANGQPRSVTFGRKGEKTDVTVDEFENLCRLTMVRKVDIYNGCPLNDVQQTAIAQLQGVEALSVNAAKLTDAGFTPFTKMPELRELVFWHLWDKEHFNGSGLATLTKAPKLEHLHCGGSTFNDEGAKAVGQLTRLKKLGLGHTFLTSEGVAELKPLVNLKTLSLSPQYDVRRLGDGAFVHLAALPALEELEIGETLLTWEGGLKHLVNAKALKTLRLPRVEISDADAKQLKDALPKVTIEWDRPPAERIEQMRKDLLAAVSKSSK